MACFGLSSGTTLEPEITKEDIFHLSFYQDNCKPGIENKDFVTKTVQT